MLYEERHRLPTMIRSQMGIPQRHGQTLMSQELFHGRKVYPGHHQMTGKGFDLEKNTFGFNVSIPLFSW